VGILRIASVQLRAIWLVGCGAPGRPRGLPRRLGHPATTVVWSIGCFPGEWRNGRRAGFRCQCPSGRGGSSPPSPTKSGSTNCRRKGHELERGRDLYVWVRLAVSRARSTCLGIWPRTSPVDLRRCRISWLECVVSCTRGRRCANPLTARISVLSDGPSSRLAEMPSGTRRCSAVFVRLSGLRKPRGAKRLWCR
jgi:hypothetical protein